MCYFLCITASSGFIGESMKLPDGLYFEDASNTPIGSVTRGNRSTGESYLLLEGGCSCTIVGRGHAREDFSPQQFLEILKHLLKESPSVSVLLHTYHGNWINEAVEGARKQVIDIETFAALFPSLEEDVRYVIPQR